MSDPYPSIAEIFKEEALLLEKELRMCRSLACITHKLVNHMDNMLAILKSTKNTGVIPHKAWRLGLSICEQVTKYANHIHNQSHTAQFN